MSITRKNTPRKGKDQETEKRIATGGAAALAMTEDGGAAAAAAPPSFSRGSRGFTAEELAELARADAEIDDAPDFLTPEERALSQALDQQAAEANRPPAARDLSRKRAAKARETPEHRAARLAKEAAWREANREKLRALSAAYNASHRQERRDYQKAYHAAHREEINAKNRARYAAKKAAGESPLRRGRESPHPPLRGTFPQGKAGTGGAPAAADPNSNNKSGEQGRREGDNNGRKI